MKNNVLSFPVEDGEAFKIKMLNWSLQFNIFCFLDNNKYAHDQPAFEWILAAGCITSVNITPGEGLTKLHSFSEKNSGWLFGHLGYNALHADASPQSNLHDVDFGSGFFFLPETTVRYKGGMITIESATKMPPTILEEINSQAILRAIPMDRDITFTHQLTEPEYTDIINKVRQHILRGDCYELNFCQHFYSHQVSINPLDVYLKLNAVSPNPFAAFYKLNDKYCLCASPERFVKRTGNTIISQPMKGTAPRDEDKKIDQEFFDHLVQSEKDKTENVMIVDLVRNDLSKVCKEGSVQVKELFGVYSFPNVHQMISTIEGKVETQTSFTEILEACFPMGSMTGAPKKKVMELIARYEPSPRRLFSGSIGYVTPSRDFDFNVVIRSLMYDQSKKLISFKAGGGITFGSDAASEYKESLLKADAIMRIFKSA